MGWWNGSNRWWNGLNRCRMMRTIRDIFHFSIVTIYRHWHWCVMFIVSCAPEENWRRYNVCRRCLRIKKDVLSTIKYKFQPIEKMCIGLHALALWNKKKDMECAATGWSMCCNILLFLQTTNSGSMISNLRISATELVAVARQSKENKRRYV